MWFYLMVLVSKIHVIRVAVKPSVHFSACLINQHKLFWILQVYEGEGWQRSCKERMVLLFSTASNEILVDCRGFCFDFKLKKPFGFHGLYKNI